MKQLKFDSQICKLTNRYSADFSLPDYLYTPNGQLDRSAMLDLVLREEYGYVLEDGLSATVTAINTKEQAFAGKCKEIELLFSFERQGNTASFPVHLFLPYSDQKTPTVVQLNFSAEIPNKYCPLEELIDNGISLAHIYYRDVTEDNDDFENGLAKLLSDRRNPSGAGKIAIWAYAAECVGYYLLSAGYANPQKLYIAGHSRLGKTALLASAKNSIFAGVLSNCSGCCGAAISREKQGETLKKICDRFPYWFAPCFLTYCDRENEMPFDQHYLLALSAPRKLCVVAAKEDTWADTDAQYLCMEAASYAYRLMGGQGISTDRLLNYGESVVSQDMAFSKRFGTHFFSRDDWNFFIDFIKRSNKNKTGY